MPNISVVPEPLADFIKSFCNVNAPSVDLLAKYIHDNRENQRIKAFRKQLHEAIENNTLTPEQYELLTDEDFDSQEALNKWLKELWLEIYGVEFN